VTDFYDDGSGSLVKYLAGIVLSKMRGLINLYLYNAAFNFSCRGAELAEKRLTLTAGLC